MITSQKAIAKGIITAFIITIISFIIVAVLLTYTDMSESIVSTISLMTTVLSALVAGVYVAKEAHSRGLFLGMLAGLVYIVMLFVILFFSQESFTMTVSKIAGIFGAIAGGGIGGILGINSKK